MSMAREEAIKAFEEIRENAQNNLGAKWAHGCDGYYRDKIELADVVLSALRPVSREQVETSWAGCEYCEKHKINLVRIEMNYNDSPGSPERLNPTRVPKFCPMCGRPLTDEAVEMVMERLEALNEDNGCS